MHMHAWHAYSTCMRSTSWEPYHLQGVGGLKELGAGTYVYIYTEREGETRREIERIYVCGQIRTIYTCVYIPEMS